MKSKIILIIIIFMAAFSLSAQEDDNFDYGSIKNAVYTNSYFGITVPFPSSWHVKNYEQIKDEAGQGAKAIAGDNKKLKAICKVSQVDTAYLLTVSKYKVEGADNYNPCFMMIAENLSAYPDIKTALDYLFHVKLLSMKTGVYDKINQNFIKKDINGEEFYEMSSSLSYDEITIVQKHYACIKKGFALSIIITYSSDEGSRNVHDILKRVKFNKI